MTVKLTCPCCKKSNQNPANSQDCPKCENGMIEVREYSFEFYALLLKQVHLPNVNVTYTILDDSINS